MFARDSRKDDRKDKSANVSCFNASCDFLDVYIGKSPAKADYNLDNNMWDVVKAIAIACQEPNGVINFLNFHRGGRTGRDHPYKFPDMMCQEYRDAIATLYTQLVGDPSILKDNRRLTMELPWV